MTQCLHEGATRAAYYVKNEPVCRQAVPGRPLHPEFLSEGTRLRSVKSGIALYPGSAICGRTYIARTGFAQGTEEKER